MLLLVEGVKGNAFYKTKNKLLFLFSWDKFKGYQNKYFEVVREDKIVIGDQGKYFFQKMQMKSYFFFKKFNASKHINT